MTPGTLRVLACVLTLPLVALAMDAVTSPEPADPERSRPVIINGVSEDQPVEPRDRVIAPDADADVDRGYSVVVPPPRDLSDEDSDFDDDDGDNDDDDDDDDDSGEYDDD